MQINPELVYTVFVVVYERHSTLTDQDSGETGWAGSIKCAVQEIDIVRIKSKPMRPIQRFPTTSSCLTVFPSLAMLLDKATFLAGIARACPALLASTILYFTYNALHVLCRSDPDAKLTLPIKLSSVTCPYTPLDHPILEGHPYIAPRLCNSDSPCPRHCDSRSPCPALNTLANHGYL